MNPKMLHAIGKAGGDEAFAEVACIHRTNVTVNAVKEYIEAVYEETGAVYAPKDGALRHLWNGDLKSAYREADTNLAILLESAFSDAELGLVAQSTNNHGYAV